MAKKKAKISNKATNKALKPKFNISIILICLLIIALFIAAVIINKEKKQMFSSNIQKTGQAIEQPQITEQQEPEITVEEQISQEAETQDNKYLIEVSMNGFNPNELTINPGTSVTFISTDSRRHVINNNIFRFSYGQGLNIENDRALDKEGDTFTYKFDKPGVYNIIDASFGKYVKINVNDNSNNIEEITGQAIIDMTQQISFSQALVLIAILGIIVGLYIGRLNLD